MTQEQIIEGNKIIALYKNEFVQFQTTKFDGKKVNIFRHSSKLNDKEWGKAILNYHSSYDWLIPVAKKLVEGYPHGNKFFDKQNHYKCDILTDLQNFDIDSLFKTCYNFITLINQINQCKQC